MDKVDCIQDDFGHVQMLSLTGIRANQHVLQQ
jgi:hypothetical protein